MKISEEQIITAEKTSQLGTLCHARDQTKTYEYLFQKRGGHAALRYHHHKQSQLG